MSVSVCCFHSLFLLSLPLVRKKKLSFNSYGLLVVFMGISNNLGVGDLILF